MSFFFKQAKQPGKVSRNLPPSVETLRKLQCKVCPLNRHHLINPKMEATGAENPLVYILGEAPGENEDERGEQFVGKAGSLLRGSLGKGLIRQSRFNNCIRCHPPKNRNPSYQELECCRNFIVEDIEKSKPEVILGFGNIPLKWLIGQNAIGIWRGRRVPVQVGRHTCWFYPMYHPSYVLRGSGRQGQSKEEFIFDLDIDKLKEDLNDLPVPHVESPDSYYKGIEYVTGANGWDDIDTVYDRLQTFSEMDDVAIDIETRGLRPYSKDSMLLTVSIGTYEHAFGFPLTHPEAGWKRDMIVEVE